MKVQNSTHISEQKAKVVIGVNLRLSAVNFLLFSIYHAFAVLNIVFKFWPEMLNKTKHWRGRGIAQRTNSAARNITAHAG